VLATGSALTFDGATLTVNNSTGGVFAVDSTVANVFRGLQFKASGTLFGYFLANSSIGELRSYIGPSVGWGGFQTWYIDNSERMRLNNSGNLGIGTSSPGAKLDVTGGLDPTYNSNVLINSTASTGKLAFNPFGGISSGIVGLNDGGIGFNAAGANTERMRLNASGNLGIGTTSPATRLDVIGGSLATSGDGILAAGGLTAGRLVSDGVNLTINPIHTYFDSKAYEISAGSTSGFVSGVVVAARSFTGTGGEGVSFWTRNIERARIDGSGNLLVGTTTQVLSAKQTLSYGSGSNGLAINCVDDVNATDFAIFRANGAVCGAVSRIGTTSAVAYVTTSDYRAKENIAPMTGALAKVLKLKPVTYDWKSGGSSQGFIAHELQAVVPDAVVGEKDAIDADGNPKYQGIDTSFLVATLTAAIQEQQALIQSLTDRIAQLENKL
jgi:hypothetical protein